MGEPASPTPDLAAESWLDGGALQAAEALICAEACAPDFETYLADLAAGGGAGWSPCVQVWEKGAIAYRCKTCQMTASSAVCHACFKAGGHENHDYVMYKSESGGCCDCGDLSSWKFSGCCPEHRPPLSGSARSAARLPGNQEEIMRELLGSALNVVALTAQNLAAFHNATAAAAKPLPLMRGMHASPAAVEALEWLQRCSTVTQLRGMMVEEICRPFPEIGLSEGLQDTPAASTAKNTATPGYREASCGLRSTRLVLAAKAEKDLSLACPTPLAIILESFPSINNSWIKDLTTLLMVMLYDVDFKYSFSSCLCKHYENILMQTCSNELLSTSLDRLTVQLFSIPAITLRLVQEDGLLEVFVGALFTALKRAQAGEGGHIDPTSELLQQRQRMHIRILLDLKMILCHTCVVVHMMVRRPKAFHLILDTLELMQGMCPQVRQKEIHIEQEDTSWAYAIVLEEQMLQLVTSMVEALDTPSEELVDESNYGIQQEKVVSAGDFAPADLPTCLERSLREPGKALDATVASLAAGAERALQKLAGWAIAAEYPKSISHIGKELFEGAPTSISLPLHRAAGAFMQGLMILAEGGGAEEGRSKAAKAAVHALMEGTWLSGVPGNNEHFQQTSCGSVPASAWRLVATHPLRLLVWLSQIRARLWVRNGISMQHIDAYYRNVIWRDVGLDMDYLLLQLWLAATPFEHKPQAMIEILEAFGAHPLIRGMVLARGSNAEQASCDPLPMEEPQLTCTIAGVRLLVNLLRDGHITCGIRKRLRHQLIHHLAIGAKGYNHLSEAVGLRSSSALFDAVLAEVAVYVDPDLRQQGHYKLRPECWAEFDSLFLHYQPQELQAALERAQTSGQYKPHFQLRSAKQLSAVLQPMQDLLLSRRCQLLEWACLRYAWLYPSNSALELSCLAMQLVAQALSWIKSDDVAAGKIETGRSRLVQMLAGSGQQWAYGPGGIEGLKALVSATDSGSEARDCAEHLLIEAQAFVDKDKAAADATHPRGCRPPMAEGQSSSRVASSDTCHSGEDTRMPGYSGGQGERKRSSDGAPKVCPSGSPSSSSDASAERRRKARQRQQEMMRRMALQQAAFSAQACDDEDDSDLGPEIASASLTASGQSEADVGPPENVAAQDPGCETFSSPCSCPQQGSSWLDPSKWIEPPGECIYCHMGAGADSGPLGSLCHAQVNAVPVFALRDYSDTWQRTSAAAATSANSRGPVQASGAQHPGSRGSAEDMSKHSSETSGMMQTGDANRAGTGEGGNHENTTSKSSQSAAIFACGPMFSELDCRPGQAVLSCGHMMHYDCFLRFRKDQGSSTFLCPICRRLSNGLLPAAGSLDSAACPQRPPTASVKPASLSRKRTSQQLCLDFLAAEMMETSLEGRSSAGLLQALLSSGPEAAVKGYSRIETAMTPGENLDAGALDGPWTQRLGTRSEMAFQFLRSSCGRSMVAARNILSGAGDPTRAGRGPRPTRRRRRTRARGQEVGENGPMGMDGQAEVEAEDEAVDDGGTDQLGTDAAASDMYGAYEQRMLEPGSSEGGQFRNELQTMLMVQGGPSGSLWGLVGHTLVQWEVMQRPPAGDRYASDAAAAGCAEQDALVRSAYWRSLQGLVATAAAAGSCLRDWRRDKTNAGERQGSAHEADADLFESAGDDPPTADQGDDELLHDLASWLRQSFAVLQNPSLPGLASAQASADSLSIPHDAPASSNTPGASQGSPPVCCWREVLRFLLGDPSQETPVQLPAPLPMLAGMIPRLMQDEACPSRPPFPKHGLRTPPAEAWEAILSDPFILLLELLAHACATEPSVPPEDSLASMLPVVYLVAVNQAAVAAVASSSHQVAKEIPATLEEVSRLISPEANGSTLSNEMLSSVHQQLGPFLARVLGLQALLAGDEMPQGPFFGGEDKALVEALGLLGVREALLISHRQPGAPRILARWCGPMLRMAFDQCQQQELPLLSNFSPRSPASRPGLMPLPRNYHDLFLALSNRKCDYCGKVPSSPALCLLTGSFMCCDSHCGCLQHVWKHSAGTGIFLLPKVTQLLIVRNGERACNSHQSTCLYLDAHGEEDIWIRRGRALHLSEPRYHQITALWSSGALDYDTSILFASFPVAHNQLHPIDRDRLLYRNA